MSPRALAWSALIGATAVLASLFVLLIQPWDSGDAGTPPAPDSPAMTLEGVIALVSAEHAGCPDQPALVLAADATYDGDGIWTVTFHDYTWTVDETDRSVRTNGDELPCPGR